MAPSTKIKLPRLMAPAEVRAETWNEKKRTVDVVFTTGFKGLRSTWFGDRYYEELVVTPEAVRLERLNAGAPVLDTHSSYSLGGVLGVVEKAWLENGLGVATLRFSERADVQPIVRDIASGIIRNVSVGYQVHTYEKIESADGKIPTYRAVDWEPCEISPVPVGFDPGAQIRAAGPSDQIFEVEVRMAPAAAPPTASEEDSQMATQSTGGNNRDATRLWAANTDTEDEDVQAQATREVPAESAQAAVQAERQRVSAIRTAVRTAKLGEALADKLIDDGTPLAEAREIVIGEWAKREAAPTTATRDVRVTRDEHDSRREGIENALLLRTNSDWFKPLGPVEAKVEIEKARIYRGLSLADMAREYVEAQGVNTRGMSRHEFVGIALNLTRAGSMSTSDFPLLLANLASKTLRRAYDSAPRTWAPLSRQVSAPDFKEMHRVQLGEAPELKKVEEGAEFTVGRMGEAEEKYKLAVYGRLIAISRQTIINDDLGAITRIAELFGRAAADLESDTIWGLVTANAAMGDGTALFHANHSNLAGSGGAISVTTIGAGREAMRKQKGLDGKLLLNVAPRYLIVPAAKETIAEQFVSAATVIYAAKSDDVNPFKGTLAIIAEARLDASSGTAWFLAADYAQIDVIEHAYLEGQEGLYTEMKDGFEVDGVQIKARLDFGAKVLDWRGLYKNGGA